MNDYLVIVLLILAGAYVAIAARRWPALNKFVTVCSHVAWAVYALGKSAVHRLHIKARARWFRLRQSIYPLAVEGREEPGNKPRPNVIMKRPGERAKFQ